MLPSMISYVVLMLSMLVSISEQAYKQKKNTWFPKKCTQLTYLPMPKSIKCELTNTEPTPMPNPCNIKYVIKIYNENKDKDNKAQQNISHFIQLIQDQQQKTFRCRNARVYYKKIGSIFSTNEDYIVQIQITNGNLQSAFLKSEESYKLNIGEDRALIQSQHYVGFVRGLQTFMQSITCNSRFKNCYFLALPISIKDQPLFIYRGLMVDTARHYIPMYLLKETIDAMMYNKLNIFHWHIVDDDSFPLELNSHPQMAEYGAFSQYQRYTIEQVKDFIHYAMIRGVRIIPQIDTPGHAATWSQAPQNQGIACIQKSSQYKGPLDVTLDRTYQVMKQIFTQIFELFPDPYVHLGGDEVQLNCLANKTQFMNKQGVEQQSKIQLQYRRKQRQILSKVNSTKKFIYWIPDQLSDVQQDDIVHWWGKSKLVPQVQNRKIIISQYVGQFYIDMGVGNILGGRYYSYSTWLQMYQLNIGKQIAQLPNKSNVIGCTITLWTQMSNLYTHHTRIWIRTSSSAQRMWTDQEHEEKPNFLRRITAHQRLMNRRGIPTASATCQQCQENPQFC